MHEDMVLCFLYFKFNFTGIPWFLAAEKFLWWKIILPHRSTGLIFKWNYRENLDWKPGDQWMNYLWNEDSDQRIRKRNKENSKLIQSVSFTSFCSSPASDSTQGYTLWLPPPIKCCPPIPKQYVRFDRIIFAKLSPSSNQSIAGSWGAILSAWSSHPPTSHPPCKV